MNDRNESRSERYSVKELEDFQQRFESLRREFHRQGIHSGQRGCEFALEAIRRYQMEVAQSSEIVARWRTVESAPLGQMALLWHRAWRHPWAGQVINHATGECVLDTPTPEHKVAPHFASHWQPLDKDGPR